MPLADFFFPQTIVQPLSYLKVPLTVQVPGIQGGIFRGLWWSLVIVDTICPITWVVLCLTGDVCVQLFLYTACHCVTVGIFVWMHYPECANQISPPPVWSQCHPVTLFYAYLMAKSFWGVNSV